MKLTHTLPMLLCIFLFGTLSSCKKDVTIHENLVVEGNVPPPYSGVTRLQVENYINKLYIDLIGFEPTATALASDADAIEAAGLSESAREAAIDAILAKPEHNTRVFNLASSRCLNGLQRDVIQDEKDEADFISNYYLTAIGDTFLSQVFEFEALKLQAVLDSEAEYAAGTIDINEMYRRFCYNLLYDEINMGSLNFVIAVFEDLFYRPPTVSETDKAVDMVDGVSSDILGVDGGTKGDFLGITTESSEFHGGMVVDAFKLLLARDASPEELAVLGSQFEASRDYGELLKEIAKTDEYAGF